VRENRRVAGVPYLEQPLGDFLAAVSAAERTPASGSIAALLVAMAAAVVGKAARLSAPAWSEADDAAAQADALRDRAAALAQRDAELYAEALRVLAEPDSAAPGGRDLELGRAIALAAEPPLQLGEVAADTVMLAEEVVRKCDPSIRTDVEIAAGLAAAAADAAAELVAVNLTAQEQDERVRRARALAESAGRTAAAARGPSHDSDAG
jgi:formiminotetrahydrofolate cyclodeaminase